MDVFPTESPSDAWLALVATPIGNLEDITLRALRFLREADIIAAEDTRRARKLLTRFDIHSPLTAYHAHNEHQKTQWLLDQVAGGQRVAVVADAGTPAVADPGFFLVRAALERGVEPTVIPGPSALTYAVVAAGLPVDRFVFLGFPPNKSGKRRRFVEALRAYDATVFLYESPHRMTKLLVALVDGLGAETQVAVVREATKLHEERIRGTAGQLAETYKDHRWRGELVVAVDARAGT
ncbi:MAG: 16S rRNA (cytidine(1402)-2'-O)-methyltransferase [Candidatus Pacebacteria bacterium]|nr:16S rRNA (cytidine(1402)-2'-O)-methyltransferase [Candidatus Paceibacterota bacterium]